MQKTDNGSVQTSVTFMTLQNRLHNMTSNKKLAIITGISGQDGAYLSQFLLQQDYRVIGLVRSSSGSNVFRLQYLDVLDKVELHECDLQDITQLIKIIIDHKPDEIYNLAAQSSVSLSFRQPIGTIHYNVNTVLNILEYVEDLCEALFSIIQDGKNGEVYNVGSEAGHSPNEVLDIIRSALSPEKDPVIDYLPARPFDVSYNVLNCTKIRELNDTFYITGLEEGIISSYHWVKAYLQSLS